MNFHKVIFATLLLLTFINAETKEQDRLRRLNELQLLQKKSSVQTSPIKSDSTQSDTIKKITLDLDNDTLDLKYALNTIFKDSLTNAYAFFKNQKNKYDYKKSEFETNQMYQDRIKQFNIDTTAYFLIPFSIRYDADFEHFSFEVDYHSSYYTYGPTGIPISVNKTFLNESKRFSTKFNNYYVSLGLDEKIEGRIKFNSKRIPREKASHIKSLIELIVVVPITSIKSHTFKEYKGQVSSNWKYEISTNYLAILAINVKTKEIIGKLILTPTNSLLKKVDHAG